MVVEGTWGARLFQSTGVSFTQENPKREGAKTYDKYEKYKGARTIAEAAKLGATCRDLIGAHEHQIMVVCRADGLRPEPDAELERIKTAKEQTRDEEKTGARALPYSSRLLLSSLALECARGSGFQPQKKTGREERRKQVQEY